MKSFVFSKVAQSHFRKYLPKKETGKNTIFTNFFIRSKPQGMWPKFADYLPATLLKMNFFIGIFQGFWLQISEHLFSRTPLKWLLLRRRIHDLVKHLRWSFFVNIINSLKPLTIFIKKLHLRYFKRFCCTPLLWSYKFYLANVQVQSLL